MNFTIRVALAAERLDLIELQRRAALASETGDVRQQLLDDPGIIDIDEAMLANDAVLVAESDGRIVGFASVIARDDKGAELDGLFVEPSEWRQGIARALIDAIVQEAAERNLSPLHVLANPHALQFYHAVGFTIIGEQKTDLGPIGHLMVKPVRPQ